MTRAILALLGLAGVLGGCAEYDQSPPGPRPLTVWLDYADGTPTPAHEDGCHGAPQPALSIDDATQTAFEAGLHARLGDLAITFTTAHPDVGAYVSLIVTGGKSQDCPGAPPSIGEAPILCPGVPRSASGYVFTDNGLVPASADGWASIAAHEVGHMLGLVHVSEGDDVMYPGGAGVGFGLGTAIPGGEVPCAGGTTQDEPSILEAAVGYRGGTP